MGVGGGDGALPEPPHPPLPTTPKQQPSSFRSAASAHLREKNHTQDWREFVCGWAAASINVTLTFPLNKMIFRQQLYGVHARAAIQQLQREGVIYIYRGLLPPFLQKTTSMSLMFGMYDEYRYLLHHNFPSSSIYVVKGTAAVLAGWTEALLSPLERVQTLMQDKNHHNKWRNTLHAFRDIKAEYGAKEFYRGLTPILMRNGPSNAVFFLCREEIKKLLPDTESQTADIATDFVSGAFLGAVISTMYYPLNVVKTHMQSRVGGEFVGFLVSFNTVFNDRDRSWRKMFRGAQWNFSRSLISWGIINASYEFVKKLMYL